MTSKQDLSLQHCLEALRSDEGPPEDTLLYHLSDLSAAEVIDFASAWKTVAAEGKASIMDRLIDLSQERTELDFSAVFRRCLRDDEEGVRQRAIEGLWEHEERRLISPLCKLLADDPSSSVRTAAAVALGRFAELASSRASCFPRTAPSLKSAF